MAFSARFALEQLIDDFALSVSLATHCRVMVPTNYKGALPEAMLFRIECGITKVGGVLASINPIAHIHVLLALRRFRPQVVHVLTGEGYPWAMTLAAALAFARIPLVVTVHDPDPHPGSLLERLNARMRQSVLRNAVLHIYSEQHRRRVGELARSARIEVIPHGSLAGRFLAHRLDGVVRERLVLFFGRFGHYKGIDVLLRAVQHLPIDVRLALAGPGKLSETEQALVDQLGNRVELCNSYIGDEQVAYLMMRASVVALPYRHVTQSSVPAIANAFGVPRRSQRPRPFRRGSPGSERNLGPAGKPDGAGNCIGTCIGWTIMCDLVDATFTHLRGTNTGVSGPLPIDDQQLTIKMKAL